MSGRGAALAARILLALWLPLAARAASPTPDFTGVWMPVGTPATLRADPGRKPPLLPEADRVYTERAALKGVARRNADPVARCLPPGVPRIFLQSAPFEVLQENGALTLLFQWNHRIRVIELGQTHDRLPMPGGAYDGYPVGRFVGDQLLVDTIGFNDATWLDEQGLPHGNRLHVTERWSLEESGQRLNIAFELTDPDFYSEPWQFSLGFRRLPRTTALEEDVCVERQGLVPAGGSATPAAAPARAPTRPATPAGPANRRTVPAPPPAATRP